VGPARVPVVVKAEHREAILRDERLCDRQEGITFEGGEIVVAARNVGS